MEGRDRGGTGEGQGREGSGEGREKEGRGGERRGGEDRGRKETRVEEREDALDLYPPPEKFRSYATGCNRAVKGCRMLAAGTESEHHADDNHC